MRKIILGELKMRRSLVSDINQVWEKFAKNNPKFREKNFDVVFFLDNFADQNLGIGYFERANYLEIYINPKTGTFSKKILRTALKSVL